MGIFDGLPNPAAPALAFQQGMQQGRAEREDREIKGALSAYATNPDDPQAFATIAQWNPTLAIKIREDQTKRTRAAQVADLQRRAAGGDRTALAELAGIDIDAFDTLDDNNRARIKESVDAVGQAALRISQLPEAERPAAWDAAVDQLSPRFPDVAQYKGQYSPEALSGAIDQAKLVNDLIGLSRPSYQVVPEGGTLVNTRDPAALAAVATQNASAAPVVPPTAIEALKRGEGTPEQFDEMFGPGAAARILGNGGGAPSRVTSNFLGGL